MPTFRYTGLDSPITEFALMLVGERNCHYYVVGSAMLIGPGAAITANHVIHELHEFFDDKNAECDGNNITAQFTLQAIHFPHRRRSGAWAWDVRKVFHDDQIDVAFLQLQPTHEEQLSYKWRSPRLQLLPPTVGSHVSASGYHSSLTEIDETSRRVTITIDPYTSHGVVCEVHNHNRDSVVLPFPCFRTDSRFEGGMSGGPVFTSSGNLCGIICTNFTSSSPEADKEHASYVTTLWPSMVIKVAFNRSGYPEDMYYPAFELVKGGFITAVDWKRFEYDHNQLTGIATIRAPIIS